MNEPTLGQRIARKAAVWAVAADKEGWGQIDGHVTDRLWADLLTLCDRADAAERLADACLVIDQDGVCRLDIDEYFTALAAWRGETDA